MAKKRSRSRRSYFPRFRRKRSNSNKKIAILPLVGLGVGMATPAQMAISGNYEGALAEIGARYTGYNYQSGQFDGIYALKNGWLPFIAGVAGHMVANKVGANRAIAKVPVVGKWIQL